MFKRIVSVMTAAAMLSMLFCSCAEENVAGVAVESAPGSLEERLGEVDPIEIGDLGEIHNEVLTLYCGRHMPLAGERLGTEEFTRNLTECMNIVFELRGIDFRIERGDILEIMGRFEELERAGIIDVCNPTREGIRRYLDHEVERGSMKEGAAGEYMRILEICAARDAEGDRNNITYEELHGTGNAARDEMFIDILAHSRDFWTGLELGDAMVTVLGDTIGPDPDLPEELLLEKITAYMTDALMGLACIVAIPLTVGASIAGLISSIAASIAVDYLWEEMQDEYDCDG